MLKRIFISALMVLLSVFVIAVPVAATGPPAALGIAVNIAASPASTDVLTVQAAGTGSTMPVIAFAEAFVVNTAITSESAALTLLHALQQNAGLIAVIALIAVLGCYTYTVMARRKLKFLIHHRFSSRNVGSASYRLTAV